MIPFYVVTKSGFHRRSEIADKSSRQARASKCFVFLSGSFFHHKIYHSSNNQLSYIRLLRAKPRKIWERIITSNSSCSNLFPRLSLTWERGCSVPLQNIYTRDVKFFLSLLEYRRWRTSYFGTQGVSRLFLLVRPLCKYL